MNQYKTMTTNEVFKYWYIILIVALVIAAAVIIVVILLLRRRRVQSQNTGQGFFENVACNVSTEDNLGNTESGKPCVQAKSVPTTMKSSHTDPMITDNNDGKDGKHNKPKSNINNGIASISELLAEREQASGNAYSSMGNVYNEQRPEVDENPYSNLDEVTRYMNTSSSSSLLDENPYSNLDEVTRYVNTLNEIIEEKEMTSSYGDYAALPLDDPTSFHSSS